MSWEEIYEKETGEPARLNWFPKLNNGSHREQFVSWLKRKLNEQISNQPSPTEPRKYTVQELEEAKNTLKRVKVYPFSNCEIMLMDLDIAIHLIEKEIVYLRDKPI